MQTIKALIPKTSMLYASLTTTLTSGLAVVLQATHASRVACVWRVNHCVLDQDRPLGEGCHVVPASRKGNRHVMKPKRLLQALHSFCVFATA